MKYEICNTAKRPVSILCNTGESRHLPPNYTSEFLEAEVINNPSVEKLERRGLIRCYKVKQAKSKSNENKKKNVKAKDNKIKTA